MEPGPVMGAIKPMSMAGAAVALNGKARAKSKNKGRKNPILVDFSMPYLLFSILTGTIIPYSSSNPYELSIAKAEFRFRGGSKWLNRHIQVIFPKFGSEHSDFSCSNWLEEGNSICFGDWSQGMKGNKAQWKR